MARCVTVVYGIAVKTSIIIANLDRGESLLNSWGSFSLISRSNGSWTRGKNTKYSEFCSAIAHLAYIRVTAARLSGRACV